MNTFDYCGINSATFNCYYIPDESDRFDDKADYDVYDAEHDFHDGGVYYGNRVGKREFSLKCYFEDVDRTTKEKMMLWLDRKTSGELSFEETPWKYYKVRPTKKVTGKSWTHRGQGEFKDLYSGTFTITFTAYEPFAFMKIDRLAGADEYGIQKYCGILPEDQMPAPPTPESGSFIIYNCGTQVAYPIIRVSGTMEEDGYLELINNANETTCKLIKLPQGGYLEIDSTQGLVTQRHGSDVAIAFDCHDQGYLKLEPCGFVDNDVIVGYEAGSNEITLNREIDQSYVGKFIYYDSGWHRITYVGNKINVFESATTSGTESAKIVTMNLIAVRKEKCELTRFDVEFVPRIQ